MTYNFDEIIDRRHTNALNTDGFRGYIFHAGPEKVFPYKDEEFVRMWVADMEFGVAPEILDALRGRIDRRIFGYTGLYNDEYYKAFSKWCRNHYDWSFPEEQLCVTPGIIPALYQLTETLCTKDEKVLVNTPAYGYFVHAAEYAGVGVLTSPLHKKADGTFEMDFEDFEKKCADPACKLVFWCNPQNPTGRMWTEEELRRMMELCLKHHVLVVSDEIHSDLIFHGKRHIPTASLSPEIAANVVTGISATKTFNLAGLQASTAVFPNAHMKAMFDKFWTDMDIHRNNAFSVTAMEVAFNEGEEWLEQLLPYISANFDFVVDYCEKHIPRIRTYAPDATYLMWLDCRDLGLSNEALHDFMIQKAKLGLNDGCAFGRSLNGYMRLNAACPRSILEQAMRQLEAAVNSL